VQGKEEMTEEKIDWEQAHRELKSRYKSLQEAVGRLEGEVAKKDLTIALAEAKLVNAQNNVMTRKLINDNALGGFNAKEQMYIKKLDAYRNALKELGYNGDLDTLGD
jgi:hypothetical protein